MTDDWPQHDCILTVPSCASYARSATWIFRPFSRNDWIFMSYGYASPRPQYFSANTRKSNVRKGPCQCVLRILHMFTKTQTANIEIYQGRYSVRNWSSVRTGNLMHACKLCVPITTHLQQLATPDSLTNYINWPFDHHLWMISFQTYFPYFILLYGCMMKVIPKFYYGYIIYKNTYMCRYKSP